MTVKVNRVLLLFFLICLPLTPGLAAAACTIPGTAADCKALVTNLPWPFIIHVKEQEPVRITYMSTTEKPQLNPNVKMFLEVGAHESHKAAGESFSQILAEAHPDMGLSYGWDLVLPRDKLLYRLHADCTLAEQHFMTMVASLKRITESAGKTSPRALFCRCGGGCRIEENGVK